MDEDKKRKVLLAILIVLIVILLALMGLIYRQLKTAREVITTDDSLAATTATATAGDNISVSYDLGSPASSANSEILEEVKDVANRFMQAKEDRSLEQARAYMTDGLYKATSAEEFAGTSSPSMDRFQITNAMALKTPDTYQVEVTSYWLLNGESTDTVNYKLIVKKESDKYLVDEFETVVTSS